jgi:8-oxo-dGTP pyrophosphatase MutT (NUDIX family)
MAGILPVAYHKNKVYFLFGRETKDLNLRPSGLWSDFGGTREKGETLFDTAIREGYEETDGVLGSKKHISLLINNNLIDILNQGKYTSYMIMVPYNKALPKNFKFKYNHIKKHHFDLITAHNGFYEKDQIKWFSIESLKKNIGTFRPWYRPLITKLIKMYV